MNRRGFLIGVTSLFAAPAIVRASSLMPVRALRLDAAYLYAVIDGKMFRLDGTGRFVEIAARGPGWVRNSIEQWRRFHSS